jgi:hypothetical protein
MTRSARFALVGVFLFAHAVYAGDAAKVTRNERDLIAIVNLSLLKNHRFHYVYEEDRAVMKIKRDLRKKYRRIHLLTGKHATHDEFLNAIADTEADPGVKAIDVVVYLHGQPGAIGFVDTGFYPVTLLRDEILAQAGGSPRKLRALYSDACYGETDMTDWLRAGFRAVSGSVGVDANWSLDLNKFMRAWARGKTFGYAIGRANSVWATKLMDRIAGGDSFKKTEGATDFTIDRPVDSDDELRQP